MVTEFVLWVNISMWLVINYTYRYIVKTRMCARFSLVKNFTYIATSKVGIKGKGSKIYC